APIIAGPDGNLWFFGPGMSLSRISTDGAVTSFPLPISLTGSTPFATPGLTTGPDGNVWIAAVAPGTGIGRITPDGEITQFPIPAAGGITAGPDGNLWLTETGSIGQIVLGGGGFAGRARLARAVRLAVVDALFVGGRAESGKPVVLGQSLVVAAIDIAFSRVVQQAVTPLPIRQAKADAGILPHLRHGVRAAAPATDGLGGDPAAGRCVV